MTLDLNELNSFCIFLHGVRPGGNNHRKNESFENQLQEE